MYKCPCACMTLSLRLHSSQVLSLQKQKTFMHTKKVIVQNPFDSPFLRYEDCWYFNIFHHNLDMVIHKAGISDHSQYLNKYQKGYCKYHKDYYISYFK